jgi:peroxiredoxin
LARYQEVLPEFRKHNAALIGISVDGVWCHRAYAAHRKLTFPCSPTSSRRAVSRAYGAYLATAGTSCRSLFVIDEAGVIRWSYVSPVSGNPGADGILTVLETLDGVSVSS